MLEKFRSDCIKNHKFLITGCSNCKAREQSHVKFPICSRCRNASYCDTDCQSEHYKKHKEYCLAKSSKPEPSDVSSSVPLEAPCPCFTKKDKHFYSRQSSGLCSYIKCNNQLVPPYEFSVYVVECPLITRGLTLGKPCHIMQTQYCSTSCKKRACK